MTGFLCQTLGDMVRAVDDVETLAPRACRDHMARRFGVDQMLEGYERVFRQVTGERAVPPATRVNV